MTTRWCAAPAGVVVAVALALGCDPRPTAVAPGPEQVPQPEPTLRVALLNAALNRAEAGQLRRDLHGGADPQALEVAAILQRVRPEVLVLLEVDRDPEALAILEREYLAVPQDEGGEPLRYGHRFVPTTNTGVPSGLDLDRDGRSDGPGDALGFGAFPGQYGLVILSRYPLDRDALRCFGDLRWRDFVGARLPDDPRTEAPADWYGPAALERLPLSSKNHCVVPVETPAGPLHLLVAHPVPPVFDGPEDRNGLRNHDEIRLLSALIDGGPGLPRLLDDDARFVVAGDLNADPHDGDATGDPVRRFLLDHPRIATTPVPGSEGAVAAAARDGGANAHHRGPAAHDTADFPDAEGAPGNLRTDYLLPSRTLEVTGAGVFWPAPGQPGASLVDASDHRLVWLDLR